MMRPKNLKQNLNLIYSLSMKSACITIICNAILLFRSIGYINIDLSTQNNQTLKPFKQNE